MHALVLCFGGTFDPVHNGHLAIARAVRDALDAEVRLVPAADPPHKGPTHADAAQRAAMLDLAVDRERGLRVDRRELLRPGPSYTVDTVRGLRAELGPHVPLVWMIGSDSLFELDSWHRWRELFEHAHVLAVGRPGSRIDPAALAARAPAVHAEIEPRWRAPAQLHALPAGGFAEFRLAVERPESSTELRRRIARGAQDWREWVPPAVAGYIAGHGLYGA